MSISTFFMPKTNSGGEEVLKYVSNEIKFTLNRKLNFSAIMTLLLIIIYNEYSFSFEKLEALCDNKDTERKHFMALCKHIWWSLYTLCKLTCTILSTYDKLCGDIRKVMGILTLQWNIEIALYLIGKWLQLFSACVIFSFFMQDAINTWRVINIAVIAVPKQLMMTIGELLAQCEHIIIKIKSYSG